jgi:hypothetical protein
MREVSPSISLPNLLSDPSETSRRRFLIWNAVLNATSFMRLAGYAGLAVSHAE